MSLTASEWALRQNLGPVPKFVLVVLADAANDQNICWPRISTVANRVGVSRRTVQRAIQYLVQRGLVTVVPRNRNDGSSSSNLYRLMVGGGVNLTSPRDNMAPPPDRGVTPPCHLCHGEGVTGDTPLTTRRTVREPPPLPQGAKPESGMKSGSSGSGGEDASSLHYPEGLLPSERDRATVMVRKLSAPVNQQVLDEWAGIMVAGDIRASPLGCLRVLVQRAQEGTFTPERAMRVAQARKAKQRVKAQMEELPELAPADESNPIVHRMQQIAQRPRRE
ncbi:MAG: helix-turn-helix domain-containing protein [Gammaproteobacteria bacterium]|nr:helix-turn-helix domain-containing protein [Gammaproteobacteria bacterium]